jgi:hypothetical protein
VISKGRISMEKRAGTYAMSTFLAIMMLLGAFFVIVPGEAAALQDGDYVYTTGGIPLVATITEYAGAGGAVNIPPTLGGLATAAIGTEAFNNNHGYMVTSVKIPDSVTSIGDHVFANCNDLVTVEIGNGVRSIGWEPFYDCTSLTSVAVDVDNLYYTSNFGVLYNKNLTALIHCPAAKGGQVIIPNSVTSIGWMAFDHRAALSSVTIGSGVKYIDDYAFDSCTSLTTVTFAPSSTLTTIGNRSFFSCSALASINFPNGVTT